MKFYIVHYNTPELTTCLCDSINKFHNDAEIIIFDNSDKLLFNNSDIFTNVKLIDNTKNNIINFEQCIQNMFIHNPELDEKIVRNDELKKSNFGSFKHSLSIQYIIENENEPFFLLDSDILLKKNLNELINNDIIFSAEIENNTRILPFLCFLSPKYIKENDITFCNDKEICPAKAIDTGCFFYRQIIQKNILYNTFKFNDFAVHFGNGSWKENGNKWTSPFQCEKIDKFEWLNKYKDLWR